MDNKLEAEVMNEAGRMKMVEGYRLTPRAPSTLEYFMKAEERFKKAHELDSSNPHYTLNIADALFALGKIDEANKYYNEAASKMKQDSSHLAGVNRRWGTYIK